MSTLLSHPALAAYAAAAVAMALAVGAWVVLVPSRDLSRQRRQFGVDARATTLTRATTATTGVIDRVMSSRGDTRQAANALDRAGIRMALADFVLMVVAVALVAALLGYLLAGPFVAVFFAAMAAGGGYAFVSFRAGRRKAAFADQLDDILQLLASNMRAGHSLQQSMDSLAREVEEPAASEISRIVNQTRVGRDLGSALDEVGDRMDSDDFRWVAQAIAIHRQVGGNLADVLDTVGETIRERAAIRRQVKALSAEGKLSAYVLMALPIGVALLLSIMNPGYLGRLFDNVLGLLMVGVALVMLLIGGLWLRKMITIKF